MVAEDRRSLPAGLPGLTVPPSPGPALPSRRALSPRIWGAKSPRYSIRPGSAHPVPHARADAHPAWVTATALNGRGRGPGNRAAAMAAPAHLRGVTAQRAALRLFDHWPSVRLSGCLTTDQYSTVEARGQKRQNAPDENVLYNGVEIAAPSTLHYCVQ